MTFSVSSATWCWLALLFLNSSGCARLLSPLMDDGRYVTGTWAGRVTAVTVHDRSPAGDLPFKAAALEIESGPAYPARLGPVPDEQGGGRTPLLSRSWDKPLLITDPDTMPVGKRVEVRGRMQGGYIFAPGAAGRSYFVNRIPGAGHGEHFLLIDGEPKVLDK